MERLIAVLVLAAFCSWGQDTAASVRTRCNLVTLLERIRAATGAQKGDELPPANQACEGYLRDIRIDPARAANLTAKTSAYLDQRKLTAGRLSGQLESDVRGLDGAVRFHLLPDVARTALDAGETEAAQSYARELLRMSSEYTKDPEYGTALYYGYFVLGRVALRSDNVGLAGQYLVNAGSTPGSPSLDAAGPDMTLARELLEKGQFASVSRFLALCGEFWKQDSGRLREWAAAVRGGNIPDFR